MTSSPREKPRFSGVLLHPTSLPLKGACGGFGEEARKWLELLSANGIRVWQVLPLSPPDSTGSPYSSPSSFALSPYFIDLKDLEREGFLLDADLRNLIISNECSSSEFNFKRADLQSKKVAQALFKNWPRQSVEVKEEFHKWSKKQNWLEDHSFFMELRRQNNGLPWWEWPKEFSLYDSKLLMQWKINNADKLLEHSLMQWHLFRQWSSIRKLAKDLGILIFGDLPFYVSRDSSDVWSNRSLFSILTNGDVLNQSGVPPDYFSETGQLWGTPVYRWKRHKSTKFRWWRKRISRQWELFDLIRLDHFRALSAFWAVPGKDKTAEHGFWVSSPGLKLLELFKKDFAGKLPLIAEEREHFSLPGMKILQFAFDGNQDNPYLPENITDYQSVVYSGTHDNSTTNGWWESISDEIRERVLERSISRGDSPSLILMQLGMKTKASLFISPMQDLLGLGEDSRLNRPGTIGDNWKWKLVDFDNIYNAVIEYGELAKSSGRNSKNISILLTH